MPLPYREFKKLDSDPNLSPEEERDYYLLARQRVTRFLIQYTLIESHGKFIRARQPYPFNPPSSLRPGSITPTKEYHLQNSALVILLDGVLPPRLHKHFRCRSVNRVNKKNIALHSPGMANLDEYETIMRNVNNSGFFDLMRMLLPLDFALFIQQDPEDDDDEGVFQLTHFHVKIERLMDNALRSMGLHLNYIRRNLFELDEDFLESLEKKFFEYFNFYQNAAGRRSAAALAAQLLAREGMRGTVFVASQQDRRLTLLNVTGVNQEIEVEQYLLQQLDHEACAQLREWGQSHDLNIERHFLLGKRIYPAVVTLRTQYEHTEAALPSPNGELKKQINLRERWVRLKEEAIVPIHTPEIVCIDFPTAYRRHTADDDP